jgi:heat shock protein HslJ
MLCTIVTGTPALPAGADHPLDGPMEGGRWVLKTLRGAPISTSRAIFFEINNSVISGFDGCNDFGGPIDRPLHIRKTQRACTDNRPSLPLDLAKPLEHLATGIIEGSILTLPVSNPAGEAIFDREE